MRACVRVFVRVGSGRVEERTTVCACHCARCLRVCARFAYKGNISCYLFCLLLCVQQQQRACACVNVCVGVRMRLRACVHE